MTLGSLLKLSELHFLQLQMELLGLNTVMLKNGLKAEPGLSAFLSYPKSLRAALGISTTKRRVME